MLTVSFINLLVSIFFELVLYKIKVTDKNRWVGWASNLRHYAQIKLDAEAHELIKTAVVNIVEHNLYLGIH